MASREKSELFLLSSLFRAWENNWFLHHQKWVESKNSTKNRFIFTFRLFDDKIQHSIQIHFTHLPCKNSWEKNPNVLLLNKWNLKTRATKQGTLCRQEIRVPQFMWKFVVRQQKYWLFRMKQLVIAAISLYVNNFVRSVYNVHFVSN